MKRKWDWVAAAAFVLGSVACGSDGSLTAPTAESSGSHALSGRVMEESDLGDRPSALARVEVTGGGIVRAAVTAVDGKYLLEGLPAGRLKVVVQKPRYATETADIDLRGPQELDFYLMHAEKPAPTRRPWDY